MVTEPLRILIAIHGQEPDGWTAEVRLALAPYPDALVRVLVVEAPPPAGFTSLLPAARRRYAAAVHGWRQLEARARRESLAELEPQLPREPEVVHATCARGDAARAIVEHSTAWRARILVVGRDARSALARGFFRPVHVQVVQEAPCAIIVAPALPSRPVAARPRLGNVATGVPR
jgi:nucleotide-binding universal stress UspA family protein